MRGEINGLALHLSFHRFSQFNCYVSFCSLIKGITPRIRMLCFVLINNVIFNLLCVWISLNIKTKLTNRLIPGGNGKY